MTRDKKIRIDKLLANNGYGSRKQVKQLIRDKRVKLGKQVIEDAGFLVAQSELSLLTLDGQSLTIYESPIFMLHKPAGYITAMEDAKHPTIADLIPPELQAIGLFPIGRLDKDTTGILLLTTDGTLCHQLLSPQRHVAKIYDVETEGSAWTPRDGEILAEGLRLFDGTECLPAELEIIDDSHVHLTIYEGKYHQVKKMAAALFHPVTKLHRIHFAGIDLAPELAVGDIRQLSAEEEAIVREQVQ